jgi:signal recognition particle receptor subunit beta
VAQVDFAERQLTLKLVYYGPPLSGKTSNLRALHANVDKLNRGRLMTLDTRDDRTLFFDLLPIFFRTSSFSFRIKVYTVPGQPVHEATRKVVLAGADGVVFVADSQRRQLDENIESYRDLHEALAEQGIPAREMPLVLQYNKQDLPPELVCLPDELERQLNFRSVPSFSADALAGTGVFETLRRASELVLRRLSSPAMAAR